MMRGPHYIAVLFFSVSYLRWDKPTKKKIMQFEKLLKPSELLGDQICLGGRSDPEPSSALRLAKSGPLTGIQ